MECIENQWVSMFFLPPKSDFSVGYNWDIIGTKHIKPRFLCASELLIIEGYQVAD